MDEAPSFNRTPSSSASTAGKGHISTFVVLGASHGGRIAKALCEAGREVIDLSDRGWKLTKPGVAELASRLDQVKQGLPKNCQLILSVLDSALFWGETEEGAAPSRKLADNKYHLEGKVVLAGKEIIAARFALLEPLLHVAGKLRTALLRVSFWEDVAVSKVTALAGMRKTQH